MEIDDIRAMTDQELQDELGSTRNELMNLRFRVATMQLANTNEIPKARRGMARINTIIRQRELAQGAI